VVKVVALLLIVNTFLFLLLDFGAKYVLPKASLHLTTCEALTSGGVQYHAPAIVCWYADRQLLSSLFFSRWGLSYS
jgi:hypothetical protein